MILSQKRKGEPFFSFRQLVVSVIPFKRIPNNETLKLASQPISSFSQNNIVVGDHLGRNSFKIIIIKWFPFFHTNSGDHPSRLRCNHGYFLNGEEYVIPFCTISLCMGPKVLIMPSCVINFLWLANICKGFLGSLLTQRSNPCSCLWNAL